MVHSMRGAIWLGVVGGLVAGVVASAAVEFPQPALAQVQAAPVRAPDFRLPRLGGGTVSLSQFTGKPVILLFWAPW
jgi:cytochrome oxidase Cu insertion factor (SCO1/SenC/PrrC family)